MRGPPSHRRRVARCHVTSAYLPQPESPADWGLRAIAFSIGGAGIVSMTAERDRTQGGQQSDGMLGLHRTQGGQQSDGMLGHHRTQVGKRTWCEILSGQRRRNHSITKQPVYQAYQARHTPLWFWFHRVTNGANKERTSGSAA